MILKVKHKLKPLLFQDTTKSKPTSEDLLCTLLPVLREITENTDISYCPKSYKLLKVMTYEPSGEMINCPAMISDLLSGYYGCIPEKRALQEYKKEFKTGRTSYHFLFFCLLTLEQRLNQARYFIETRDCNQTDYPLWIWTTYNVLCYHCKIFKDLEMTITICSLLEDYISGFLSKLKSDIM